MSKLKTIALAGLLGIGVPLTVWGINRSSVGEMTVSVLEGQAYEKLIFDQDWKPAESRLRAAGSLVKTGKDSKAVLALPGHINLRLSPDSKIEVVAVAGGHVTLNLLEGRAFVTVACVDEESLKLTTPASDVTALTSSFVVDVEKGKTRLQVLDGSAQVGGERVSLTGLPGVSNGQHNFSLNPGAEAVVFNNPQTAVPNVALLPSLPQGDVKAKEGNLYDDPIMAAALDDGKDLLALEGSDVRKREVKADVFKKGKPKGVTAKKHKVTPTVTPSPEAVTNTTEPPVVVEPPPPPPPEPPPPTVTGGGDAGPWVVGGLAAAALAIYFAEQGNNNNQTSVNTPPPNQINVSQ